MEKPRKDGEEETTLQRILGLEFELDALTREIHDSEDRFEAVFNQSAVGILLSAPEGRWLRANRKLGEILGYHGNDLIALRFQSIIHPDDLNTHLDLLSRLEAGEIDVGEHEARLLLKDGSTTWSFITISLVREAKGELDYFVTVFEHIWRRAQTEVSLLESKELLRQAMQDVSHRRHVEKALRENEKRFRDFSEAGSDWFWEFDKDLCYSFLAPGSESVHEYDTSEFIGKPRSAVKPEGIEESRWQAHLDDLNAHRPFRDFIQPRQLEDGSVRWLSVSGKPLFDENGTFTGYRGTATDITEHRKLDRMKREFVATVSHELRTPLTSIKRSLGLVVDGALGQLPEDVINLLDVAQRNTERLINLVNDILDMEKLDSGNMEFDFQTLDLSGVVREAVEINKGLAEEFSVEFILGDLAPELTVRGDSRRLTQAVTNLLSNAAKFSSEGDKVEIAVCRNDGMARVSVTDHGSGVPEEFREFIFGRFAQLNASDNRQTGGTGLGLSITKSIVEKHDGTIGFDSDVDIGTTFFFTLPVTK